MVRNASKPASRTSVPAAADPGRTSAGTDQRVILDSYGNSSSGVWLCLSERGWWAGPPSRLAVPGPRRSHPSRQPRLYPDRSLQAGAGTGSMEHPPAWDRVDVPWV